MGDKYTSIALIKVDSASQGRVALQDAVSWEVTTTQEKTPVNTMNKKRVAKGYRISTKAISWSMEVALKSGEPELDWEELRDLNEEFLITWERDENGKARQLIDAVVNEVAESEGEDGSAQLSITGLALDNVPVIAAT